MRLLRSKDSKINDANSSIAAGAALAASARAGYAASTAHEIKWFVIITYVLVIAIFFMLLKILRNMPVIESPIT